MTVPYFSSLQCVFLGSRRHGVLTKTAQFIVEFAQGKYDDEYAYAKRALFIGAQRLGIDHLTTEKYRSFLARLESTRGILLGAASTSEKYQEATRWRSLAKAAL